MTIAIGGGLLVGFTFLFSQVGFGFLSIFERANAADNSSDSTYQVPQPRSLPQEIQDKIGQLQTTRTPEELAAIEAYSKSLPEPHSLVPDEPLKPEDFRAVISAQPKDTSEEYPVVDVAIGQSVAIPFEITFEPQTNPHDTITVTGVSVGGEYIPAAFANDATAEEAMWERIQTGEVTGALDLASIVSFSPSQIDLRQNESKQVLVIVAIPADWPEEAVGDTIPYPVFFKDLDNDPRDVLTASGIFSVRIVE